MRIDYNFEIRGHLGVATADRPRGIAVIDLENPDLAARLAADDRLHSNYRAAKIERAVLSAPSVPKTMRVCTLAGLGDFWLARIPGHG
ncbi:unnamed protein product, partial [Iphiclides podalirius]